MIDFVIACAIRFRVVVIVSAAALAVCGAWAVAVAPIDAIPDLSETQVIVYAAWPGHDPHQLHERVASPLSQVLRDAPGVRTVRSSSDQGAVWVHVIFDEWQDIERARQAVAGRLRQLDTPLPDDVHPQLAPDAPATGQVFWYTLDGGGLDLGERRELHKVVVQPALSTVPGVAEVATVGGHPVETHVTASPERMAAQRVTWRELFAALDDFLRQSGNVAFSATASNFAETNDDSNSRRAALPSTVLRSREALDALSAWSITTHDGRQVRVGEVASLSWAPGPRQGILEKDGSEAVGGVVMMRYGQNPVEVIERVKQRIAELSNELPRGVRVVTGYDRTPLVQEALSTVTRALLEAMLTAVLLVLVVMRHFRASLVIALTLPIAVVGAFVVLGVLRWTQVADIPTNIMSLAGIVISIGVLVDASIVTTENVLHQLQKKFGDTPVTGDVRPLVERACQAVGRPIFFSVLIMLLSFLPVFALHGLEGKMFRPLAVTKSLVLLMVAVLAVTLVPALASWLVRGRLQSERENPFVRSLIDAYRPLLAWLLERPAVICWWVGVTMIVGLAPLGRWPAWFADSLAPLGTLSHRPLVLMALVTSVLAVGLTAQRARSLWLMLGTLVVAALVADRAITPLASEFLTPLDERTVMDMPISVPRMTGTQAVDDLKARNMLLCRFPEVEMAMGKAGRADTPTDPAPIEMIETMISFRPESLWPARHLADDTLRWAATLTSDELTRRGWVESAARDEASRQATWDDLRQRFDALLREYCYHRYEEQRRAVFATSATRVAGTDPFEGLHDEPLPDTAAWRRFTRQIDRELAARAPGVLARLTLETALSQGRVVDDRVRDEWNALWRFRQRASRTASAPAAHHGGNSTTSEYDPLPLLDGLQAELTERFARRVKLTRCRREQLIGFGGEFDRVLQMPGWANVWTMPIQNRVDMLATGVNTTIGVRVLGPDLRRVWETSEKLAEHLRQIPGAQDVVADPIQGKGGLAVQLDRQRVAEQGVDWDECQALAAVIQGGKAIGTWKVADQPRTLRVTLPPADIQDAAAIGRIVLPKDRHEGTPTANSTGDSSATLAEVAEVRFVDGPAAVKGEGGRLRNYVRLNVRNRDAAAFVAEAQRHVAEHVPLPEGVALEWTGQFEHQQRARQTLLIVLPLVVGLIAGILYWTYRDWADAVLMLLAVPGAAAGGLFFQWLFGFKFSVNVWIGYIACFGMATSTGIVMLVYLREAIENAGGLAKLTEESLKEAVLRGATQRLRPKLLTEGTTLLSLAPMLFASGVGAEVIRPMAAPVLGGILVADEIIDLFLPVMFYAVRRRRLRRLQAGVAAGSDSAQQGAGNSAETEVRHDLSR